MSHSEATKPKLLSNREKICLWTLNTPIPLSPIKLFLFCPHLFTSLVPSNCFVLLSTLCPAPFHLICCGCSYKTLTNGVDYADVCFTCQTISFVSEKPWAGNGCGWIIITARWQAFESRLGATGPNWETHFSHGGQRCCFGSQNSIPSVSERTYWHP